MNSDLVSIIMPTFNSSEFVLESIRSIQAQSYSNWELLVTDDCSSDNTVEITEKEAKADSRIKLFQLPENCGAGVSRNNSIAQASGRYIAFCDSDDQWMPHKLERQIQFMQRNEQAFSYASYKTIDEDGIPIGSVICPPRLTYTKMLRNNYVGCLTAIYDTEILGKQFMPVIRNRQDWALWLKLVKQCGEARGIQEPLAIYRYRSASISNNKIEMLKYHWVIFHDLEKLGVLRSSWCMIQYIWHYLEKKLSDIRNDAGRNNVANI